MVTYQKLYRDARSAKYKNFVIFMFEHSLRLRGSSLNWNLCRQFSVQSTKSICVFSRDSLFLTDHTPLQGAQIFETSNSHLKILGAKGWNEKNSFLKNPKVFAATVQNLFSPGDLVPGIFTAPLFIVGFEKYSESQKEF